MKIHNRRRISRQKYTILFSSFVADISALTASKITGVNRKTADRYFNLFRRSIFKQALQERQKCNLKNGVELDESYFVPRRVRGKQGRGAGRKVIVSCSDFLVQIHMMKLYLILLGRSEKGDSCWLISLTIERLFIFRYQIW